MSEKVSSSVRKTLDLAMKTNAGVDFMEYLLVNNRTNEVYDFINGDKVDTLNSFDSAFDTYANLIKLNFEEGDTAEFNKWKNEVKQIIEQCKKKHSVPLSTASSKASIPSPKSSSLLRFMSPASVPKKDSVSLSTAFSKASISSPKKILYESKASEKGFAKGKEHLQKQKDKGDFAEIPAVRKQKDRGGLAESLGEGLSESSRKERLDQLSTIENIFFENSCDFNSYLESNETTREKISRLPPRLFLDEILKMSDNLWFCGDISSETVDYIKILLSSVHSKVEMQSNLDLKIIKSIDDYLKNTSFSQFLNSEYCNYGENALSEYLGLYISTNESNIDRDKLKELRNLYEALIKKEIRESPNKGILTESEKGSSDSNKFMFTNSPFILPKVISRHKISSKPSSKSPISGKSELNLKIEDLMQKWPKRFDNLQSRPKSSAPLTQKDKYGDLFPVCMSKTKTSDRVVLYNNKSLELINVLGDGSCFYHSIAHILRKLSLPNGDYSQVTGHELRRKFVTYLKEQLTDSLLGNKGFAVKYIIDTSNNRESSSDSRQILINLEKLLHIGQDYLGDERSIMQAVNRYLGSQTYENIEKLVKILLGSISNIGNYFNEIQAIPFANFLKQIGTLDNFQTTINGYIVLNVTSRRVGKNLVSNNGISTYPLAERDDNRIMVYLNSAPHYNAVKKVGTGDFNDYIFSARKSNWSRDLVDGTNNEHQFY